MTNVPVCLQRLALGPDADERSIRRAYARELKRIDQDTDAHGFQALREAYEAALSWASYFREEIQADQPRLNEKPEPPLPESPVIANADSAQAAGVHTAAAETLNEGDALMNEFNEALRSLAELGDAADDEQWPELLHRTLADPRLDSIAARNLFEQHIASMLSDGWRQGHDGLFVAAVKIFNWGDDQRRLLRIGHAGFRLNQAINEYATFLQQPAPVIREQNKSIARLRNPALPSQRELASLTETATLLATRFPSWMALVTDVAALPHWQRAELDLPPWMRPTPPARKDPAALQVSPIQAKSSFSGWPVITLIFAVICFFKVMSAMYSAMAPVKIVPYKEPIPVPSAVTPPELKEKELGINIKAHLHYAPEDEIAGNPTVVCEVDLFQDGTVIGVRVVRSSGLDDFNTAVVTAIRDAQPYPYYVPRQFTLTYRFRDQP